MDLPVQEEVHTHHTSAVYACATAVANTHWQERTRSLHSIH